MNCINCSGLDSISTLPKAGVQTARLFLGGVLMPIIITFSTTQEALF